MDFGKNLLIYVCDKDIKPVGGPRGYLYNLKRQIEKLDVRGIDFLQCKEEHTLTESLKRQRRRLPNAVDQFGSALYRHRRYRRLLDDRVPHYAVLDLGEYDYIHFHSTESLYSVRDSLREYHGKILLTSHSPKPAHVELIQDYFSQWDRVILKRLLSELSRIDEYAFANADYIIFPCPEAEEPYFKNWPEYEALRERNASKYRYLLTGIEPCIARKPSELVRKEYNVPRDAFVISYVGRHNETKGYDLLKKIAQYLIPRDDRLYFMIAGKEEPLTGLNHKQWIEVGWTDDPHSIIAASDLFMLPNRETYFDLVMLEALSLGRIVIASNTGGNRYFLKLQPEGIILFSSIEEAINSILNIQQLSKEEREDLGNSNRLLYETHFTAEKFCKSYIETIRLLGDS